MLNSARLQWRTNLLKNTLVHRSGMIFLVRQGELRIGPLPPDYPAAKLAHLYEEAVVVDAEARQRWTGEAIAAFADRLQAVLRDHGLNELRLERTLDEEGELVHCRMPGTALSITEVLEIFADCIALGVLLPARQCRQEGAATQALRWSQCPGSQGAELSALSKQHVAVVTGFPTPTNLQDLQINFDSLSQLVARHRH